MACGIDPRRLQIKLHTAEVIERNIQEVSATSVDQILLFRRRYQNGVLSHLPHVSNPALKTAICPGQNLRGQPAQASAAYEKAQSAGSVEFAPRHKRVLSSFRRKAAAEMAQIVEAIKEQPWMKARLFTQQAV